MTACMCNGILYICDISFSFVHFQTHAEIVCGSYNCDELFGLGLGNQQFGSYTAYALCHSDSL